MRKIKFAKWLLSTDHGDNIVRDLAEDVRDDSDAPVNNSNYYVWLHYLYRHNACQGALDALKEAFIGYGRAVC